VRANFQKIRSIILIATGVALLATAGPEQRAKPAVTPPAPPTPRTNHRPARDPGDFLQRQIDALKNEIARQESTLEDEKSDPVKETISALVSALHEQIAFLEDAKGKIAEGDRKLFRTIAAEVGKFDTKARNLRERVQALKMQARYLAGEFRGILRNRNQRDRGASIEPVEMPPDLAEVVRRAADAWGTVAELLAGAPTPAQLSEAKLAVRSAEAELQLALREHNYSTDDDKLAEVVSKIGKPELNDKLLELKTVHAEIVRLSREMLQLQERVDAAEARSVFLSQELKSEMNGAGKERRNNKEGRESKGRPAKTAPRMKEE